MIARKKIFAWALTVLLGTAVAIPAQGQPARNATQMAGSVVLWVREIHGQALYWVGRRAVGRAPLSGIVAATQSFRKSCSLIVVIDSSVPIQEMAEIGGLTAKLDVRDVHYYVYSPVYPKLGMSEIVWRTQTLPLPGAPPPVTNGPVGTR